MFRSVNGQIVLPGDLSPVDEVVPTTTCPPPKETVLEDIKRFAKMMDAKDFSSETFSTLRSVCRGSPELRRLVFETMKKGFEGTEAATFTHLCPSGTQKADQPSVLMLRYKPPMESQGSSLAAQKVKGFDGNLQAALRKIYLSRDVVRPTEVIKELKTLLEDHKRLYGEGSWSEMCHCCHHSVLKYVKGIAAKANADGQAVSLLSILFSPEDLRCSERVFKTGATYEQRLALDDILERGAWAEHSACILHEEHQTEQEKAHSKEFDPAWKDRHLDEPRSKEFLGSLRDLWVSVSTTAKTPKVEQLEDLISSYGKRKGVDKAWQGGCKSCKVQMVELAYKIAGACGKQFTTKGGPLLSLVIDDATLDKSPNFPYTPIAVTGKGAAQVEGSEKPVVTVSTCLSDPRLEVQYAACQQAARVAPSPKSADCHYCVVKKTKVQAPTSSSAEQKVEPPTEAVRDFEALAEKATATGTPASFVLAQISRLAMKYRDLRPWLAVCGECKNRLKVALLTIGQQADTYHILIPTVQDLGGDLAQGRRNSVKSLGDVEAVLQKMIGDSIDPVSCLAVGHQAEQCSHLLSRANSACSEGSESDADDLTSQPGTAPGRTIYVDPNDLTASGFYGDASKHLPSPHTAAAGPGGSSASGLGPAATSPPQQTMRASTRQTHDNTANVGVRRD